MPTYNEALENYHRQLFAREDGVLSQIRAGMRDHGLPTYTIRPEEGRFLQFLVAVSGARMALEIGTLGGYSGTWIARGLKPGGRLITVEKEPKHADLARQHFTLAGLEPVVDVRAGDAHELLPELASEAPFDFVFLDADKEGYLAYLDWALENMRPGGVLAAHNAFRNGAVVEEGHSNAGTKGVQDFNQRLSEDERFLTSLYPAGDGMAIAMLKG